MRFASFQLPILGRSNSTPRYPSCSASLSQRAPITLASASVRFSSRVSGYSGYHLRSPGSVANGLGCPGCGTIAGSNSSSSRVHRRFVIDSGLVIVADDGEAVDFLAVVERDPVGVVPVLGCNLELPLVRELNTPRWRLSSYDPWTGGVRVPGDEQEERIVSLEQLREQRNLDRVCVRLVEGGVNSDVLAQDAHIELGIVASCISRRHSIVRQECVAGE